MMILLETNDRLVEHFEQRLDTDQQRLNSMIRSRKAGVSRNQRCTLAEIADQRGRVSAWREAVEIAKDHRQQAEWAAQDAAEEK